jgi:dinuclear metal center YbgI/SA1388 family protein
MAAKVKDILAALDAAHPFAWAVPEDRVGLQVGDPEAEVRAVLVALEVSPGVIAEAETLKAQLLLTHHPLLYQPLSAVREDQPGGRLLAAILRAGLAVAACHTNLDLAPGGLNEYLAERLGLQEVEVLGVARRDPWLKLTVFVPLGYEDPVRAALMDDRVGVIGRYAHCSFAARGQGTYRPLEGARPFKGEVAALSRAEESRLEVLVPESRLAAALGRLRQVHPYEEIAYDLYPLANPGLALGFGRVGTWPGGVSGEEAVARIKAAFGAGGLRLWGEPRPLISRVAVCGGSGGDLIRTAHEAGAELYVTGEVRHHQAVPPPGPGLAVAEVGHFASEVVFMPVWAERLQGLMEERGLPVRIMAAGGETPPCRWL